jgi:hypothetical protein
MITASALTRYRNCTASAVLPRAENHNVWADAGQEDHEVLADLGDPEHPFAHLIPPGSRPEVKLAYDVASRTGRVIGEGAGRDYGTPGPFEIVGSCDVLGVESRRVVIIDWKTGHADVEPAATNAQLWFYALAACRALGKDEATVVIVYTQTSRVDQYEIDALELAQFASDLERLHVRVAALQEAKRRGEAMETREGSWCKHCSSKPYCPSKNALLVQVASGGLAIVGDSAMTAERAVAGYHQIVRVEALVKEARARLHAYVDENGPIAVGDGVKFGRDVRPGNERIEGAKAVVAIREVAGEVADEIMSEAVEYRTSKAALKRAAKAVGQPRLATQIEKRIRELGGITRAAESYPYREYPASAEPEIPAVDHDALNAALESA